jgi:hypothetical protein
VVIGTDRIGSCKPNYHAITTALVSLKCSIQDELGEQVILGDTIRCTQLLLIDCCCLTSSEHIINIEFFNVYWDTMRVVY